MVYAGVILVAPRLSAAWAGLIATVFCWTVEAAQLTGIPAELSARNILARAALGVHFDWADILCSSWSTGSWLSAGAGSSQPTRIGRHPTMS